MCVSWWARVIRVAIGTDDKRICSVQCTNVYVKCEQIWTGFFRSPVHHSSVLTSSLLSAHTHPLNRWRALGPKSIMNKLYRKIYSETFNPVPNEKQMIHVYLTWCRGREIKIVITWCGVMWWCCAVDTLSSAAYKHFIRMERMWKGGKYVYVYETAGMRHDNIRRCHDFYDSPVSRWKLTHSTFLPDTALPFGVRYYTYIIMTFIFMSCDISDGANLLGLVKNCSRYVMMVESMPKFHTYPIWINTDLLEQCS